MADSKGITSELTNRNLKGRFTDVAVKLGWEFPKSIGLGIFNLFKGGFNLVKKEVANIIAPAVEGTFALAPFRNHYSSKISNAIKKAGEN